MTVKSEIRFFPSLLSNRHYSGTVATLLYNWPIFVGLLFFGVVALIRATTPKKSKPTKIGQL